MIKYGIAAVAAVVMAGTAQAVVLTPTELVQRHMAAAAKMDVDAIVADYADDAVALQNGKAAQGKDAIRALFAGMFPKPAAGAVPAAKPAGAPKMNVTRVWEEGNVGFVTWTMGPMTGTDEFLVRDGKIAEQAVFVQGPPPAAAPAK